MVALAGMTTRKMALSSGKPSMLAAVGLLCGLLLLGFAGLMVVSHDSHFGDAAVAVQRSLGRRLQLGPTVSPVLYATASPIVTAAPAPITAPIVPVAPVAPVATVSPLIFSPTTFPSSFDSMDGTSSGSSSESSKSSESASFQQSGLPAEELAAGDGAAGSCVLAQLLIMICFASCYYDKAVLPVLMNRGTLKAMNLPYTQSDSGYYDDFDNGICECASDKWVCLHGLCCPLVRMAHTNAAAGVCGFWESAICWCGISCISVGIGPCCLMVYWRMRLKEIMGITEHRLNDFCITLFCPMLSICQQGTAVDAKLGYQVTGCCELEWATEQDMLLMSSSPIRETQSLLNVARSPNNMSPTGSLNSLQGRQPTSNMSRSQF